jgi:nucleoside-diphosphate-sugar epimerase
MDKSAKIFVVGHRGLNKLGWRAAIPLREGIAQTSDWFVKNVAC